MSRFIIFVAGAIAVCVFVSATRSETERTSMGIDARPREIEQPHSQTGCSANP